MLLRKTVTVILNLNRLFFLFSNFNGFSQFFCRLDDCYSSKFDSVSKNVEKKLVLLYFLHNTKHLAHIQPPWFKFHNSRKLWKFFCVLFAIFHPFFPYAMFSFQHQTETFSKNVKEEAIYCHCWLTINIHKDCEFVMHYSVVREIFHHSHHKTFVLFYILTLTINYSTVFSAFFEKEIPRLVDLSVGPSVKRCLFYASVAQSERHRGDLKNFLWGRRFKPRQRLNFFWIFYFS